MMILIEDDDCFYDYDGDDNNNDDDNDDLEPLPTARHVIVSSKVTNSYFVVVRRDTPELQYDCFFGWEI